MEPLKPNRYSEPSREIKIGITRSRSKSDLTINELESKKKGFVNRFIQKVAEMESDFAAIRRRYLPPPEQKVEAENNDLKVALLRLKLEKLIKTKVFCDKELIDRLEHIQDLSVGTVTLNEFRSVLAAQVEYVNDSLTRGILFYYHPQTKKAADLLDYVSKLAITTEGIDCLIGDKKLFLELSNGFILSFSKKLSLIHPRQEDLEVHFTELIQTITTIHQSKQSATTEDMGVLLNTLNALNESLQNLYEVSLHEIRTELFLQLKPDSEKGFKQYDLATLPLFMDVDLIDDPNKESRRSHLSKILTELIKTEAVFCKNVSLIADSTLFSALAKENVITLEEVAVLRSGWKKLQSSSTQLHAQLSSKIGSLKDSFECFLTAFAPMFIDEQIECCKAVMINYMVCKKIIDRIEVSAVGKQMLMGFSAANRLDLKDIWIMPVQRPPRYVLLAKEMVRIFDTDREKDIVMERVEYLERWVKAISYFAPEFIK